jgi:GNAT superfamily N-acetyltransferase
VRPRLLTGPAAAPRVIGTLCEAFADYPVMRYVLGPDGDYPARLRTLIGFFVAARVLRNDPVFALSSEDELSGVAICTLPGGTPPAALDAVREETWTALGADARERYDRCVRAWEPLGVAEPNLHLNMIGVPPRFQGRGLARLLLERVHHLSRDLPESRGVTLTTETAANVPLYQRFGYGIVGHATIAPGLETWGFFRPDGASFRE